jgi:hypothetical protein
MKTQITTGTRGDVARVTRTLALGMALASMAFASGCKVESDSNDSGDEGEADGDGGDGSGDGVVPTSPTGDELMVQMIGQWQSAGCFASVLNESAYRAASSSHVSQELMLTDTSFHFVAFGHDAQPCTSDNVGVEVAYDGTYAFVEGEGDGQAVDFKMESITITPVTQDAADALNSFGGYCKRKDWEMGVAVDVREETDCEFFLDAGIVPFSRIGLVDGQLLLGKHWGEVTPGLEAATRPGTLGYGYEMVRAAE